MIRAIKKVYLLSFYSVVSIPTEKLIMALMTYKKYTYRTIWRIDRMKIEKFTCGTLRNNIFI